MRPEAILAAMQIVDVIISKLSRLEREALFLSFLAQDICHLPVSERKAALATIQSRLPEILAKTELGMRIALVESARDGL